MPSRLAWGALLLCAACARHVAPAPGEDRTVVSGVPVAYGSDQDLPKGTRVIWDFGDGTPPVEGARVDVPRHRDGGGRRRAEAEREREGDGAAPARARGGAGRRARRLGAGASVGARQRAPGDRGEARAERRLRGDRGRAVRCARIRRARRPLGAGRGGEQVAVVLRYGYLYLRLPGLTDPTLALRGVIALPPAGGLAADPGWQLALEHVGQ